MEMEMELEPGRSLRVEGVPFSGLGAETRDTKGKPEESLTQDAGAQTGGSKKKVSTAECDGPGSTRFPKAPRLGRALTPGAKQSELLGSFPMSPSHQERARTAPALQLSAGALQLLAPRTRKSSLG